MAFIVASIIGAGGAIAGGLISAHGATSAANTQAQAADQAAQLQYQSAQNALDFQKQQYATQQQQIAPWLQAGQSGLANLEYAMGLLNPSSATATAGTTPIATTSTNPIAPATVSNPAYGPDYQPSPAVSAARRRGAIPELIGPDGVPIADTSGGQIQGAALNPGDQGSIATTQAAPASTASAWNPNALVNTNLTTAGSLMQPWNQTFTAPDLNNTTDPGYKARLQLAQDAIQRSAAASGGLLSGGTAKALDQFTQDYASNEYNNVYNRALNTYGTNYNTFQQNQANQFNRLAALSGSGQTASGQLASSGQAAANNVSNIYGNMGAQVGSNINNAGAARASGYVGTGNAIGGAVSGGTNSLLNLYLMNQLMGGGGISGTAANDAATGAYLSPYGG